MSRRSSPSSDLTLWLGGAVLALIGGLLIFLIVDRVGLTPKTGLARIDEVRFRPAYTSTSGSGEDRKTKHHAAEWRVDVITLDGKDTVRRSWSPPAWMAEDAFVKATYTIGRISHSVSISNLEPAR